MATGERVPIDDIVVGERARKDYGDLTDLMDSIQKLGLLQPIGLAPGNHLLFGGRRLQAAKLLGQDVIAVTRPLTQTDALSLLKAERAENTCRKDMTPEELYDIGQRIKELEAPRAAERQREGQQRGAAITNAARRGDALVSRDTKATKRGPRTADKVAEALGPSTNTLFKIATVVETARGERDAPPDVQALAQRELQRLNAGETTPNAANLKIKKALSDRPEPVPEPEPEPKPRPRANRRGPTHLQLLQSLFSANFPVTLKVAEQVTAPLDSSVTAEEASRLMGDLNRQIQSLNGIRNLLKERKSC